MDKIYLNNTNLIYPLAKEYSNTGNIRATFFLNHLSVKFDVIVSPVSDFLIGDYTFVALFVVHDRTRAINRTFHS